MKRKRKKKNKSAEPVAPKPQESTDLADYLHQLGGAVGDDVGTQEDFRQTFAGWQDKWRQRPLEHWLEQYKNTSSSDDGSRDKPT